MAHPRNLQRVALGLAAMMVAAFALAAWSLYSSHKGSCQARDVTLGVMSGLLVAAQQQTDSDPTVTAAKKAASDRFVAEALAQIASNRC